MEGRHSVSAGHVHDDDSWTCQHCGWVYPNAHPSAKHRRNHKKHCGKIKGFELRSELHQGGSSDEASSGDDSHTKKDGMPPQPTPIEAGSAVPAEGQLNAPQSRDLLVTEVNVSPGEVKPQTPLHGISASINVKPELQSELHQGGSSDEASSSDASHTKKDDIPPQPTAIEAGSAVPAEGHLNAPLSGDLLVTEVNVPPDEVKPEAPILPGVSAPLNMKPEVTDHQVTRDISIIHGVETDSSVPELEPKVIFLDKTSNTFEEGKSPAHFLPGLYTDEAKEFVSYMKCEDPPTVGEQHSKSHTSQADRMEAVVGDLPGLDLDQENNAAKKDAIFEGKHTESIASPEEPSKTQQDDSKVTLTPHVDEVKVASHESQVSESDHEMVKESSLISKEQGLNQRGSSQVDDSWTCRHCGWIYPNPHPSAKHRKKHKKQCGKVKGFELHTEPHPEGSSDEVSSDEDVHGKKEHVPHQSPQILQSEEQASETVSTESLPQIVDYPAILVEGGVITESESNLQPKEFAAHKVVAPDGELGDLSHVKDITTRDMVPSVVPELPQNLPSLDQQNRPAGDNKKDAVNLDQDTKVSCVSDEPDTPLTTESPKHASVTDERLPNQAFVQEILKGSETPETQLHIVDTLTSEGFSDLGKEAHVEHELIPQHAEEPAGISSEYAPNVTSISSVSDLKSSDASPTAYFEDKGASIHKRDEPHAVVMSATDPRSVGWSSETSDVSAGAGLNQSVIPKKEIDVSEKLGLSGLDNTSSFDALDDIRVGGPLRKEMYDTLTGGSKGHLEPENRDSLSHMPDDTLTEGSDGQLEPENSDVASHTLPANEIPAENKSVTETLQKEVDDVLTGGLDAQLDVENSDLSSHALSADDLPVVNELETKNLLPLTTLSTANVTGLANDAQEEQQFLNVQSSVNPVQLTLVDGGNDETSSSSANKTDETGPVTNIAHLLDNQMTSVGVDKLDVPKQVTIPAVSTGEAKFSTTDTTNETSSVSIMVHPLGGQTTSVGVAEVEVPKEVTIPAVTTAEAICSTKDTTDETPQVASMADSLGNQTAYLGVAEVDVPKDKTIPDVTTGEAISIQKSLDGFSFKDVSSVPEDSSQGATGGITEITNTTGVAEVDVPKEKTIPDVTIGDSISIQKSLDRFLSKDVSSVHEDSSQGATGGITEITNTTNFLAKDPRVSDITKEGGTSGIPSVKDGEHDKTEASGALQVMTRPGAEEETAFETGGIGLSDLSYTETHSFTRSESGLTARSELGASSHKLSDSLEIYEDAQDSLETCSVGGSVEENESLDEPHHHASDRVLEEPKHSGPASLHESIPGESVVLEQKSSVSNGSKLGEASYEEKAPTFGEASYEEKEKVPTLPGPNYDEKEKAPTSPATNYDEKAPTLSGNSYGGKNKMEDLKAPSPEAWQEPGPSNVKREGKNVSTSEVTEDSNSGESHTALRNLMAKEVRDKAEPIVVTSTGAADLQSSNRKNGSLPSANGTKTKSRPFWSYCVCCSTVH